MTNPAHDALLVQQPIVHNLPERLAEALYRLDETHQYLAASVSMSDVFRIVADVLAELFPMAGLSLFGLDDTRTTLKLLRSNVSSGPEATRSVNDCFATGFPCVDGSNASVPLNRDRNIFGVLEVRLHRQSEEIDKEVLYAIAERVSPLIVRALSAEKSRRNATVDLLTQLPNERAFHQITEECLAKGQRLALLVADILNLDEINLRYGHAGGDRLLQTSAAALSTGIRGIDRLARSNGSEFLILIPGSDGIDIHKIIDRLTVSVANSKLEISAAEILVPCAVFGWASSGCDGDTPARLLNIARARCAMYRSTPSASNIIEFKRKLEK